MNSFEHICTKQCQNFVHYTELFELLKHKNILVLLLDMLIWKKRLMYQNKIINMNNDGLLKKVVFSDAFEEKENLVTLFFLGNKQLLKISRNLTFNI